MTRADSNLDLDVRLAQFIERHFLNSPSLTFESRPTDWRSIALAAVVHVALLAFLWIGVQWQSKESPSVEAEIWDLNTREAAPLPTPTPPPIIEAIEKLSPPPVAVKEEVDEEAEIILAQEKKRKILAKQKLEEKRKAEQAEAERKELLKEKKLAEKKLADKKAELLAKKQAAEELEKKKLADAKKLTNKEQLARDKLFEDNLKRLNAQASTVGAVGSGGTGDAAKSTGNNRGDPSYAARIAAKVRANTVSTVTDNSSNNPTVEYRIELLPDGSLRGAPKKLKSSGNVRFDEEVENGIRNAAPFPKDKTGFVPQSLDLIYKMKESL